MNSVKILHTADLHLGSSRTNVKGGKAEIENTFFKIINLCRSRSVDFLLISGDLFDTPYANPDLVAEVVSAIEQIPDTTVAISPGNHDAACPGSIYLKYTFPKNTVIFSSFLEYVDFPQKNVRLWGAGFTDRFERLSLLHPSDEVSPDMINICVLHGDVVAENSPSVYNAVYPSAIQSCGFDYLALGHIHKRSAVQKSEGTCFAYSGCPDATGFDEPGSLGVYLGEVEKGRVSLEFYETSSRKYISECIDISKLSNTFEVSELILNQLKESYGIGFDQNLYRITLTGTAPLDTDISASRLSAMLSDRLYYIEVTDKSEADIQNIEAVAGETSLRGIFARKMLERIASAPLEQQTKCKNALKIGLRAFGKGVGLNDN